MKIIKKIEDGLQHTLILRINNNSETILKYDDQEKDVDSVSEGKINI